MWIRGSDGKLINSEHVSCIYLGADRVSVKASFVNGDGCHVGKYQSQDAAETAILEISKFLKATEIPDNDRAVMMASARHEAESQKWHNGTTGKKTSRTGGS